MPTKSDSRKHFLLGALTVIILVVGLTLLVAAFAPGDGSDGLFQRTSSAPSSNTDTTIAVVGFGQASAPAASATLQLVVVPSRGGYASFGRNAQATAVATPNPTAPPPAAIPIIDALLATGLPRTAVDVVNLPTVSSNTCFGSNCPQPFRVDVTVSQPQLSQLNSIVGAVSQAASNNSLNVNTVGASYTAGDCQALVRQARQAAIQDAQAQAEAQAELLNLRLGSVKAVSDVPAPGVSGPRCTSANATNGTTAVDTADTGLTVPAFDPKTAPAADVSIQVSVTYTVQ